MLSECFYHSKRYLKNKIAAPIGSRDGDKFCNSNTRKPYRNRASLATFDLDRIDRILSRVGDDVFDEIMACGFSERDAYQAARAAINAATDRLLQAVDRLEVRS